MCFPREYPSAAELRVKFDQILPHLDERRRRLYLASEAITLGHGGITVVAAASDTSTATIARGISELTATPTPTERIRAPGAGRKPLVATDTGLLPALEALIEPHTRGDPVSALRWTTLSLRTLAATLTDQGHPVGATAVGHLLHALGYRLQGTAKTNEGARHPDRDAQFAHINATAAAFLDAGQPVISIDTKAMEWLGNRDAAVAVSAYSMRQATGNREYTSITRYSRYRSWLRGPSSIVMSHDHNVPTAGAATTGLRRLIPDPGPPLRLRRRSPTRFCECATR
uniref:Transposase n=1 Tax=Rhodococcus sp. NS1 TaxID=402236 RepID=A0A097SQX1_9NOCA|nr:hypothetical protein LRS1606.492 [Rhodococcus sp. NS1]